MRTRRLRMRKMKSRRKGGANTTRKAIMKGKIDYLEAKCKAKYNRKDVDKQLKSIEKKLNEIMYQKEKLESKKEALINCQNDNGLKESSGSFTRVAPQGHAKVIDGSTKKYDFPSTDRYASESF